MELVGEQALEQPQQVDRRDVVEPRGVSERWGQPAVDGSDQAGR